MASVVLYFLSLNIFTLYIGILLAKFGVPASISESSYLYGKNGNYVFGAGLSAFIAPMLIAWLNITTGQTFQFLVFLSCAALCFTAFTGRYRGDGGHMQWAVHTYGTIVCAFCAQIWMWVYIPYSWTVSLIILCAAIISGKKIKGARRNLSTGEIESEDNSVVFFVELSLFFMAYISIALFYLYHLLIIFSYLYYII